MVLFVEIEPVYPQICPRNKLCYCDFVTWLTIHSFIHSGHFYSASLRPLLLRSATDIARILCRSFTPKRHRQLQVKDLSKVPTWQLERDSYPRPFGRKASNLPMRHQAPLLC